jgi:hypothetical protein
VSTDVTTGFVPSENGFRFSNRFSGVDILNELRDGLGDSASSLGDEAFWSTWGLCGGMSWHALDRYFAGNAMLAGSASPERDTALFRTLVLRQVDSFKQGKLIAACLRMQSRHDTRQWWDPRPSLQRRNISHAWPNLKTGLDAGLPVSLTLIRATTNPGENHQVVTVSYSLHRRSGFVDIGIYDPNDPLRTCELRMQLEGQRAGVVEQDTGEPLRLLVPWEYDRIQTRRP